MNSRIIRSTFFIAVLVAMAACDNIPAIGSLQPDHGPAGTEVRVVGAGFGAEQGTGKITIGIFELKPEHIVSWSAGEVKIKIPAELEVTEIAYPVILINAAGTPSNTKKFTVEENQIPVGANLIVVANQSQPGIQLYEVDLSSGVPASNYLGFQHSLDKPGFDTVIRGVLPVPEVLKLYVSVHRRALSGNADDNTSELLVLGSEGQATSSTSVDVGLLPTGMAASPDNKIVYVASNATGRLTAVSTVDDTLLPDFSIDLAALSFGFEPLSVIIAGSPDPTLGDHLLSVIGNNWYTGIGEVITFAPAATEATRMLVSDLPLNDTFLNGSASLEATGPTLWVSGDRGGFATVAALNIFNGSVISQSDFKPGQIEISGFAGGFTLATDIVAAASADRLFVALPAAGVASLDLITDSTDAVIPQSATLIAVADRPTYLGAMPSVDGSIGSFIVTRLDSRSIDRIDINGAITAGYMTAETGPTLLGVSFTSVPQLTK